MSPLLIIFIPFVRLVGHSLAASLGFSGIAMIAVLPIMLVRQIASYTTLAADKLKIFETVETAILYLDSALLVFVIVIYSIYFMVEQWRALRKLLKQEGG
ncbi:hypothetical protein [Bradyrhizobium sp. 930_D9_N1_4]|uniref:hypothetical protein n=1 Tax=Bradyrhizobium sp. 930_D9_N1_4 TaxID=3240374 RepID=UPI003F88F2D5